MNGKTYVVAIESTVCVDTTVAVIAESEEEAKRMALRGVRCDPEEWLRNNCLYGDLVVTDISEETWDELQCADQKHLLAP